MNTFLVLFATTAAVVAAYFAHQYKKAKEDHNEDIGRAQAAEAKLAAMDSVKTKQRDKFLAVISDAQLAFFALFNDAHYKKERERALLEVVRLGKLLDSYGCTKYVRPYDTLVTKRVGDNVEGLDYNWFAKEADEPKDECYEEAE